MMIARLLLLLSGVIASQKQESNTQVSLGYWKVSIRLHDKTTREGTLVLARRDSAMTTGYIDWRPAKGHPRAHEDVLIAEPKDNQITICAYRTEALGTPWAPTVFYARLGDDPTNIVPISYRDSRPGSEYHQWTAKWIGSELPVDGLEAATTNRAPHLWGLQCLSVQYRIQDTEVWPHSCPQLLQILATSPDAFAKGLAERKLVSQAHLEEFTSNSDMSDLVSQFAGEYRATAADHVLDWFQGKDDPLASAGRLLTPNGAVSKAYDRQFEQVGLALQGLAAEHDLRGYVKSHYPRSDPKIPILSEGFITISTAAEGQDVFMILTNSTGAPLHSVVLASEFHMSRDAVRRQIIAMGGNSKLPKIVPEMFDVDADVFERAQALLWSQGAVFSAPAGAIVFVDQWDPGVTIEFCPGLIMTSFMEFASEGSLWVGASEGCLDIPLDLQAIRQPIIDWDREGRPARVRPTPSSLYRPTVKADKGQSTAGSADEERAAGALLKRGSLYIDNGLVEQGKKMLEELLQKYPNTSAAESAKRKLAGG